MKVLLVSLNAKFIHSSLALRYISSYCEDFKDQIEVLELTINHEENDLIKQIYTQKPDVIGFSCYIWNMQQIKTLIPILKKVLPNVQIVLGGPEVSYDAHTLFRTLPIDVVMEGEGEKTWYDYMCYLNHKQPALNEIQGILYRTEEDEIIETPKRMPMDLAELPFVYNDLTGLEHRIMYYEASRGCPFNCQYCLSSVEKGVRFLPLERIKQELQYFLDQNIRQIKFVDRTFNANKKIAMEIWRYVIEHDNGYTNFHFEIAAELMDDEIFELLKPARVGLMQFEIGVQSTNPEVLKIIKRPMPFEEIKKVVLAVKALGNIHQHLDLIAGLPLEDYASFRKSFNEVIAVRPEQFQLGFLKVLRGSGLRANAKAYGIVYKNEPPYEVLYTEALSFEELLRLHQIEELLERYYNSERFKLSLEYLFTLSSSPFDFFEQLSMYWDEKGYDKEKHKKSSYYIKLAEFGETLPGADATIIRDLVRFDWFMHEAVKDLPEELLTLNQEPYKELANSLIRDDEYMINTLHRTPELTSRQRLRKTHIEWFTTPVYDLYSQNMSYPIDNHTLEVLKQHPQAILFDYTATTECLPIEQER